MQDDLAVHAAELVEVAGTPECGAFRGEWLRRHDGVERQVRAQALRVLVAEA